jgi:hypothetical protein
MELDDPKKLKAFVAGTIEELKAVQPEVEEAKRYRERRHTLNAELKTLQTQVDENRKRREPT